MVFATLRIVTALFLKETLSTAANDAEMVIEDSRRFALQYQKKLEARGKNKKQSWDWVIKSSRRIEIWNFVKIIYWINAMQCITSIYWMIVADNL